MRKHLKQTNNVIHVCSTTRRKENVTVVYDRDYGDCIYLFIYLLVFQKSLPHGNPRKGS